MLEPATAPKRSIDAEGKKAPATAPRNTQKGEDGRSSREYRARDREPAQEMDRDGAVPAEKSRLARQAPKREEVTEQPPKASVQNGKAESGKHREREAGHKTASAVRSSQRSGAAPATATGHKSSADQEANAKKPIVELDDLRERALSSRRPAAKQEDPVPAAGQFLNK